MVDSSNLRPNVFKRTVPSGSCYKDDIFVADDDAAVRQAISAAFSSNGYRVIEFANGASLIAAARDAIPACIILDMHMPGASGLQVLQELNAVEYPAPILMISGRGDIPIAVRAVKNGAVDFVEKPFTPEEIFQRVEDVLRVWARRRDPAPADDLAEFPGCERLTQREREVLTHIAAGASSKEAGRLLGISFRTIEVHRSHILEKIGAKNSADLVRIVFSERRSS